MQDVPAKAEFFERAGAEIFDDNIGVRSEAFDHIDAVRRLQVHAYGLFVARLQIPPERRAVVQLSPFAKRIAIVRRFDLDDVGTELPQHAGSERRRNQGADFYDTNACERSCHGACLPKT